LPKRLVMLNRPRACRLFEGSFNRKKVRESSQTALIMDFAVLLEAGSYNVSDPDFRWLLCHYRRLASQHVPCCDNSCRRDRNGSLRRLRPIRRPSW
jgi:hypothetical protein